MGMVGLAGFEPTTSCPPDKRANQAALQPVAASAYRRSEEQIDQSPAQVHHQKCHEQLEVPWCLFVTIRQLLQVEVLCRQFSEWTVARWTRSIGSYARWREIARTLLTPRHPYSDRRRTRILIGVLPNPKRSRRVRSR